MEITPPPAFNPLHHLPINTRVGHLTVTGIGRQVSATAWTLKVRCDCGAEVEKRPFAILRSGDKAFCGMPDHAKEMIQEAKKRKTAKSSARKPRTNYKFVGQVIGKVWVKRRVAEDVYEVVCLACGNMSTLDYNSLRHETCYGKPRVCLGCLKAVKSEWARGHMREVAARAKKAVPAKRRKIARRIKKRSGVLV